jgi:hypothetical protein
MTVFHQTLPCGRNALYGDSFNPLLRSANTIRFALRIAANSSARFPEWVNFRPIRPVLPCSSCPLRPKSGPEAGRDMRKTDRRGRYHCDSSSQTGELRIMRYELTDHEWAAIKPMLPNKPCGVARVNDRRAACITRGARQSTCTQASISLDIWNNVARGLRL